MLGTGLSISHVLTYLILITIYEIGSYYSHFLDEKIRAKRINHWSGDTELKKGST